LPPNMDRLTIITLTIAVICWAVVIAAVASMM
jgi:hypothetical protein